MMVTSVLPERRMLWHPRQDNKFIVGGGSQITLYEWAPDASEIRHVTSLQDLQFMKCFAWSPDATLDDLVAVGLSTGRVDLMRLEATKVARDGVLSSGRIEPLPLRMSRPCNALAFCQADPNYLAVGLDKVRGDPSLIIWDIQSASAKFASANASNGIGSNDLLSPSRPEPRIPRADLGPRTDSRVLQYHAPTDVVSSLAFLPQSVNLLLAGVSHRWLRLFDLRKPNPVTSVATKAQGIATDPFDAHRIACFGDGVVTVWDTRRLPTPLLTFTEKDASADGARPRPSSVFTTMEFSGTRRGTLAVLEKDSTYVRFWDIQESQTREGSPGSERSSDYPQSMRAQRRSWANLPWTASHGPQGLPIDLNFTSGNIVLCDTRKTRYFNKPLSSFALVPNPKPHPLTSDVMIVNKDGDLQLYAVHDTPKAALWSSRGEFVIGAGVSFRLTPGVHDIGPPPEPLAIDPNHRLFPEDSRASGSRNESLSREASKPRPFPAIFGRGDEDGFPPLSVALSSPARRNLAPVATTFNAGRGYSPASQGHFHAEPATTNGEHSTVKLLDPEQPIKTARSRSHHLRARSTSHGRKHPLKLISHLVEDDISMVIRQRVIQGYGLANPQHNAVITRTDSTDETALSRLWSWMSHARDLLFYPTPKLHGYDFSYQGLLGIWEGFQSLPIPLGSAAPTPRAAILDLPSQNGSGIERKRSQSSRTRPILPQRSHSPADEVHGDFHAAILALVARKSTERAAWRPVVPTVKLAQRRLALELCDWSLRDEDVDRSIKRWEKDGQHSRAACWLVFTKQYSKAIDLLMRSKDESHHMMSGTLTALAFGGSKTAELREHCERLIVRLQDPYFRAMLTQLTSSDWSDVLEEELLPLGERLAIAFQFLEDKALTSYLRRIADRSITQGDIEGIVVTGLTNAGMSIIQSYLDRTGDIQTAAILSSYVCPAKMDDIRAQRWVDSYRDLLDGFKLFHHRVAFDIEKGQILQDAVTNGDTVPFKWAPPHVLIRCNYCNKPVSSLGQGVDNKDRPITTCSCGRALPRCSICLMSLSVIQDMARDAELQQQHVFQDTIYDAIVVCQSCRHGGHASHILEWFFGDNGLRSQGVCAVADCNCRCANEL